MPLNELDANASRRSSVSRSSDVSTKHIRSDGQTLGPGSQLDNISKSAGVKSMLKTTTEDDLDSFALKQHRLPKHLHAPPRRQHGIPPSRASSHYSRNGSKAGSIRSKSSNKSTSDHQTVEFWPYVHYPRVSSLDGRQNQVEEGNGNIYPSSRSVASTSDRLETDQNSLILAPNAPSHRLMSNHRSASSLRNLANNSPRPSSPYVYHARLRRPGIRPTSPAWSDSNALTSGRTPFVRPGLAPRMYISSSGHQMNATTKPSSPLKPLPSAMLLHSNGQVNVRANHVPHKDKSNTTIAVQTRVHHQKSETPPPARFENRPSGRPIQETNNNTSNLNHKIHLGDRNDQGESRTVADAPYVGFVKRVKKALEDRATMQESPWNPRGHGPAVDVNSGKFDIKPERQQSSEVKRLTRDMIKAAVGPPSDSGAISPTPDAPDAGQGETSLTESSSFHACTSFELIRSPSTPVLPTPTNETDPEAEDAEYSKIETTSACEKIVDQISDDQRRSSDDLNIENATEQQQALEEADPSSREPYKEIPEPLNVAGLETDYTVSKRPSSLPQPELDRSSVEKSARLSLPALSDLNQRPQMQIPGPRTDCSSPVCPSLSSLQTEGTAANGAGTGPSSTHSFFRSNSNASSDMSRLSAFKSYFRSKSRPFSALSEPKSDSDITVPEPKMKFGAHASDSRSSSGQFPKTPSSRIDSEAANGVEALHTSLNGSDRLSAMKQYQFTLPDLAEDSQEDASTTNIRILGSKPPNFRSGALKRARRENRISTHPTITLEPPASYLSRKLKDTRNMPSLQFSQTDLTTKLNHALGFSRSLSREDLGTLLGQELGEEAGLTSSAARQRYKSYFFGRESVIENDSNTTEISPQSNTTQKVLLTEIERLSIPSVNGLTLRLSELLPAIKQCPSQLNLEESVDANSSTELNQEVDSEKDEKAVDRKKACLISALSAGSAAQTRRSEIGTSLSASLNLSRSSQNYRLMKDLPPLPKEVTELASLSAGAQSDSALLLEHEGDGPAELEATVPIETPSSEPKGAEIVEISQRTQIESDHLRAATQWMEGTPEGPAEWIRSSSFISPEPASATEISPLHNVAISQASETPGGNNLCGIELTPSTTERIIRSMSPGPHIENFLVPQSSTASELEEVNGSGVSILGSIQKKMGKKPRIDKAGFPVDPIFLHPEERSTEPGDRYPTSGLTPPSHVNMEEARSYFSDDSSDNERAYAGTLRKRLTRLRYRNSRNRESSQARGPSRACSVPTNGSNVNGEVRFEQEPESCSERSTMSVSHPDFVVVYDQQPVGMSKLEFRAKRFVEKLRILWTKSEKLIRSMSRARRQHPSEWLESSQLYEGA